MFTDYYKGCYIHGYFNSTHCRVSFCHGYGTKAFKTIKAAKRAISIFKNNGG
jgi:hypothetical protein